MYHQNIMYNVKKITRKDCEEYVIGIHYAHRWPSISYAFGLFFYEYLCGIVTYGTPPSATLRVGIAGEKYKSNILELNRLCLRHNKKNQASMLVGRSLRLLPANTIVVSFADTQQSHIGYVYQATNFLYCGLSAKRTDWRVKGKEELHGQTIADEFRGCKNRAKLMRQKYGDDFYLSPRSRKHRYIYIVGDRNFRQEIMSSLKYPTLPYPKSSEHSSHPFNEPWQDGQDKTHDQT